jgi:glucokinase
VGGGWILDGKLFYGATGSAFEIGHMTMQVDGPFCGCGKRGCLEALTSRIAVAEQIAALAARHDAPFIYERCGADINEIRSGVIADAINAGEKMVEAVVRRAAYYTGIAVANLINVVSPEAVVLGGGLVAAMNELYLDEVDRAIREHALPFVAKDVRLSTARLGDDAVVMGAACLILDRLQST